MRATHVLSLPRLAAFVAVCEEGSLSKAAQRLCVAQPALSNMIKKLEQDLDVTLLNRKARGSVPTREGDILLSHAYDILGKAESTLDDLRHSAQALSGEIAIGIPAATSMVLTVPLIKHLTRALPNVHLKVVEAFSGYLWEWLLDGTLDISICYDKVTVPEAICQPLCEEEIFLVGEASQFEEADSEIAQEALRRYPLILPTRVHGIRGKAESYAAMFGGLNVIMEIDASNHLVELIANGEGFGLLAPCAVSQSHIRQRVSMKSLSPAMTRHVSLGVRRNKAQSPLVTAVVSELRAVAKDLMDSQIWPVRSIE